MPTWECYQCGQREQAEWLPACCTYCGQDMDGFEQCPECERCGAVLERRNDTCTNCGLSDGEHWEWTCNCWACDCHTGWQAECSCEYCADADHH